MLIKATIEELLECDESPECMHPEPEYYPPVPERHDEPGCPGGLYCPDCDSWLEEPDGATKLGI